MWKMEFPLHPDWAANRQCHSDCLSGCSVQCVIMSLCLSLLEELYIMHMPACVVALFLFFFFKCRMSKKHYVVSYVITVQQGKSFFRTVYLVRHPYVSARITICVWFYLHVVYQIWQKYTSTGTCCLLPIQHHSTRKGINYYLLTSNIKVPICLWKPNSKGDLIFHILRSQIQIIIFFSSLCISLQLLFTHYSPDPRLEATTKAGSSGITDERRWTVSGKVLWKTFNVFYISVSELSRNTWITQCQPNTA